MMTHEQKLKAIWQDTHRDYKGLYEGARTIMVCRSGATCLVRLEDLTEKEVAERLPKPKTSPTWRV